MVSEYPSAISALGSSIDVLMKASSLSARTLSRFGPTVAFEPASASVWQPLQPLDVNSALPLLPPPPAGGAGGLAASWSQLVNSASDVTTAFARMVAWPRPHSSAQTIGYSPSRLGVTR